MQDVAIQSELAIAPTLSNIVKTNSRTRFYFLQRTVCKYLRRCNVSAQRPNFNVRRAGARARSAGRRQTSRFVLIRLKYQHFLHE